MIKRLNATSGTGLSPVDCPFASEEDRDALVIVVTSKGSISKEYADAVQSTVEGYLNDPVRGVECASVRYAYNLPKAETGKSFVRLEIHSGANLTEEEAAALDASSAE